MIPQWAYRMVAYNQVLPERWLIRKWIKHVTAQVGFVHPSDWNMKRNLQLERSFFQPIKNFLRKVFLADSILFIAIKLSKNVHKCQSTPETSSQKNCHAWHFGQDQRPLTPYQSTSLTNKSCISNTRPRPLIAYQPKS